MRRLQVEVPMTGTLSMDIFVDDDADASTIEKAAVYAANEYLGDVYGPDARFCGEATPQVTVLFDEATDDEPAWA